MRTKAMPKRRVIGPPLKEVRTRYYEFTRVNPTNRDFTLLVNVCVGIGAYMAYRVIDDGKKRLIGFIVTPHRVVLSGIAHLFPNFHIARMTRDFGSMEALLLDDDSAVFFNAHRFSSVRRRLTYLHVIPGRDD